MRIIAFAYACEPGKGSEPGAGWAWARLLAELSDMVVVITRANNRDAIETELGSVPEPSRLHFEYVDLPRWARFWKKGQRGLRAYYFLWQIAALRRARRIHRREPFDLSWHLTIANIWMGSLAALIGPTFVYGPVGGGAGTPWRLARALGARGIVYEAARTTASAAARLLNPVARISWRRAELILVQNPESRTWLPASHRDKAIVFPNAIVELPATSESGTTRRDDSPTMVFAGKLLPLKGVWLAVRALEHLRDWRLIVCGDGPEERRLQKLAARLGATDRVEFRGWLSRADLARVLREETDVFVFPSLHDQAPLVVAEAISAGVPVVCLDRGAAPLLGGRGIAPQSPRETIAALAAAIKEARSMPVAPLVGPADHRRRLVELLAQKGLVVPRHPRLSGG